MIQDKCCMIKDEGTGIYEFHENWSKVAEKLGVSRQYVYKCRDEGVLCKGYSLHRKAVNRMYLVKTRDGSMKVCIVRVRQRCFVDMAGGDPVPFRNVEEVKDLTYHCKNERSLVDELLYV